MSMETMNDDDKKYSKKYKKFSQLRIIYLIYIILFVLHLSTVFMPFTTGEDLLNGGIYRGVGYNTFTVFLGGSVSPSLYGTIFIILSLISMRFVKILISSLLGFIGCISHVFTLFMMASFALNFDTYTYHIGYYMFLILVLLLIFVNILLLRYGTLKMKDRPLISLQVKKRQEKLEFEKRKEREEAEERKLGDAMEKLKKILKVSTRIKLEKIREVLDLDSKVFNEKIFDWAAEFNLTIDDEILVVNKETLDDFINALDKQFESWSEAGAKKKT